MSKEIFNAIKDSLWSNTISAKPLTSAVRAELRNQTVEGLTLRAYPDSTLNLVQTTHFIQMLYTQNEAVKLLNDNNIPVVVIKGVAAGTYYPDPSLRTYGDIDLLIKPENYHYSIQLFNDNGWIQEGEIGDNHTAFHRDGWTLELHQKIPGLEKVKEGPFILDYIRSGLEDIKQGCVDESGQSFPMLPWKQNGLELIWHFREHLYNGIGLRHAIDWMMFVNQCLSDTSFPELGPILEQVGLLKLAKTVAHMCQMYLGLDESITWCKDASDDLCEELMTFIMSQGNFGVKRQDDKAVKVLSEYRTPILFLKGMQKKGLSDWVLCQRYKFLRPFAWIYSAVEGLKHLYRGGFKKMMDDRTETKKRQIMFDKLYR